MKYALVLLGIVAVSMVAAPVGADTLDPYVLVSSYDSSSVLKYDAATGTYLGTLVAAGSGGLNSPEGLAIGPDGNLYVAGAANHVVKKYNANTGAYLGNFATGSGLQYPRGITFGPDGNLYVSSWNPGIKRFNGQTGAFIDDFVPSGTQYYGRPNDLRFRGNSLYVSIGDSQVIVRHNAITGALQGAFAGGSLLDPQGFTFGPDGNLYVADAAADMIRRYDGQTGQFLDNFIVPGDSGLHGPEDVLFNVDGSVLVSSGGSSSILRFNGTTGAFLGTYASGNGLALPTYMLLVPEPATAVPLLVSLLALRRR
jgi:streptogramin lyase